MGANNEYGVLHVQLYIVQLYDTAAYMVVIIQNSDPGFWIIYKEILWYPVSNGVEMEQDRQI